MDIQKLCSRLESLNSVFWNTNIDKQLTKAPYPNETPIESAFYRYVIAIRNKKTAQNIRKLFDDIQECLSPHNLAFQRLHCEFTSSFAEDVLASYKETIENFRGISTDNFQSYTKLIVCMSHENFWKPPLKQSNTTGRPKSEKVAKRRKLLNTILINKPYLNHDALSIFDDDSSEELREYIKSEFKKEKREDVLRTINDDLKVLNKNKSQ